MTACCTFYCHWFYSPILISTVRDGYVSCIVDVERALWLQLFDDVSEETGVSIQWRTEWGVWGVQTPPPPEIPKIPVETSIA